MSYAVILSRANRGLEAPPVRVEVHLSNGLPAFTVVGMAEVAVRESKDRVRSALINSHFEFPDRRITVNLAPADLPKVGGRFDVPIALGILCASGQLPHDCLRHVECFGELALDGTLQPVAGLLAAARAAARAKHRIVVPEGSAALCATVPGLRLAYGVDLLSLCALLRDRVEAQAPPELPTAKAYGATDLATVIGQATGRRALEIAAAGRHHLLLTGPPGTGKSLLASCLPGILSPPDADERLDIAVIHDLHGDSLLPAHRPFRSPHHSASAPSLVGGGSNPRPGEISLAHGGVLFLDELTEFSRHTLDMLREPLESGHITISRAACRVRYPACFQLVAAMNPCPCGYAGDPVKLCRCGPAQRSAYEARISGPLLDRMDLRVRIGRESEADLFSPAAEEDSETVSQRVQRCAAVQRDRQGRPNSNLRDQALLEACLLNDGTKALLRSSMRRLDLSPRSGHRLLRVARTIADLAGEQAVTEAAILEALSYRDTAVQEAR